MLQLLMLAAEAVMKCVDQVSEVQDEEGDLEVTFGPGLEALSAKLAEKAAKGKKRDTLWEDYLRRRRYLPGWPTSYCCRRARSSACTIPAAVGNISSAGT